MLSNSAWMFSVVSLLSISGCVDAVVGGNFTTDLTSEEYVSVPDIYEAPRMVDWVQNNTANSAKPVVRVSGSQGDYTLTHIYGGLALEAGRTYVFREAVDDRAYLEIEGNIILSDSEHDIHTQGVFTASKDGIYTFNFYAYNLRGGINDYRLQVSKDGGKTFDDI